MGHYLMVFADLRNCDLVKNKVLHMDSTLYCSKIMLEGCVLEMSTFS